MMNSCESINPYSSDPRPKSEQVRDMFDNIAPAYDFMNRAMTFGIDRLWRRKAVKMLANGPHNTILDVATGTGDLAILMAQRTDAKKIHGIDLSHNMIEAGQHKVKNAGLESRIEFSVADCLNMPFSDCTFHAVTVAYGVRNFEDLLRGYTEMYRVLRHEGRLTVIELSTPSSPFIRPLYRFYTRHVIPWIGRLVSKDVRAYSYLPESIAAVPQGLEMTRIMRQAGFTDTSFRRLTFGTCTIYTGIKP